MVDGLLLHPLVGPTKEGDVPAEVRMRAYEAVPGYFPPERVLLSALVAPMRYAGPCCMPWSARTTAAPTSSSAATTPGWAATTAPSRPRS